MSELDDFRASLEARREATRPGRHYDPGAYLAEQRIRESILLAGRDRRKAAEAAGAKEATEQRGQQKAGPARAASTQASSAAERPAEPHAAGQSAGMDAGAGVDSGLRSRRARRAHAMPVERPVRRHWYSLRRGHA
ncbi:MULTISPECIES: hypothetical protein [Actinoalloteichus]|uniref:Uncharacterized protein n=1 Tax=Actinoalloteichus fjordicus TaxID=1612552 RepID=A0AAC9PRJ8_9PSEU|nr:MULTISPECIES: hypothetical protein [Actinoalloteichus]APU14168.1 hypothetical protein UA74_10525 [Actinoalloteichus fjordicus]APU20114.1 hypothetical protein UA75_10495 [Actinoalloteichus sp. GBA129-24]